MLRTDAEGAGREALFRDALERREWLQQASDYVPESPAGAYSDREHVLDERARDLAEEDPETARRYFMVATGAATFIRATS